ncbi:glycosyltransferase family 2 protein [Tabrizicola sp.]|uniref:glycosyltransferase family 2 protein n=1 Tax=Tabrizicola sp. TaxID=2005166 RepID=UPI002607CA40|nr:glycosyltransferase family 2 protein [Tabrizicola sp.]MDM7932951.1 glycosyltransferase family 2 protein [Tabrizicola sp.]
MRHIISLSTIPPRFAAIGPTLASLVGQSSRPEAVELYIPKSYRRFPTWGGGLPQVPDGVTIVRVDEDLGPATKVLPAARTYRGQELDLLFADDDHFYRPDWAQRFLMVRKAHPTAAVCASGTTVARLGRDWVSDGPLPKAVRAPRPSEQWGYWLRRLLANSRRPDPTRPQLRAAHRKLDRSGHVDIAEAFAGVALRPDFLDEDAFVIPPVLWAVDDVWLSGQLARRHIPIWADRRLNRSVAIRGVVDTTPLLRAVIEGADRRAANLACVDYMRETYGIWGGSVGKAASDGPDETVTGA